MDSSPQNWLLGFSLSNHSHHHHPSPDLSLFEAFTSNSPTHSAATVAGHHHQGASPTSATDLSIFSSGINGPKLEDFLGGCTPATNTVTPTSLPQFSTADHHHQTTPLALSQNEIYDSELKTIAASFLRGFSTTTAATLQTTKLQNHHPLASSDPTPKKPADTFGQRTSIYRGVTR